MTQLPSFFCRRTTPAALFLLLPVCLTVSTVQAETRYIKPTLEVAMRQARDNNAKLVANVPLGIKVELVEGDRDWSFIRLANEAEGWVRSRYLSAAPLEPGEVFKAVQMGDTVDHQARARELHEETGRLRKELAACTTERSTLADKYQTLTADPNNPIHTKTALEESQRQVQDLQAKLATAQIEITVLKKNESIKWFLVGSGVLLFGWLLGKLGNGGRKKKPSLLA